VDKGRVGGLDVYRVRAVFEEGSEDFEEVSRDIEQGEFEHHRSDPNSIISFLEIEEGHTSVFVKVEAVGNIVCDSSELRYCRVFFTEAKLEIRE
jgi:hypothetical protein